MELEGETRGFSDKEEEEEEEEEDISRNTPNSSNYTDFLPEHHANQWQTACSTSKTTANHHNHLSDHDGATRSYNQIAPAEAINFIDLSLKIDTDHSLPDGNSGGGSSDQPVISTGSCFEREHMFDKVVTPSDVGKLNRLVIPKQHAERYFPLDSSTNEKGLILNFEDRNGKSWRFRYSYWNSSQSYVMTKGWSRFVKEKKLNAGDVVSFQRGAGELRKDRLFIDWRRRPDTPPVPPLNPLSLNHLQSVRYNWGGNYSIRQYMGSTNSPSSGQLAPLPFPRYGDIYPNYNHYHQNFDFSGRVSRDDYNVLNFGSRSIYGAAPMVIESVPVPFVGHAHGKSSSSSTSGHVNVAAKRLRLFGVNMECAHVNEEGSSASIGCHDDMLSSTTSIPDQFMTTLPLLSSPHDDLLPPADHNDLQSRLPVNQSEFPRTSGKAANAVSFDWMINPSP